MLMDFTYDEAAGVVSIDLFPDGVSESERHYFLREGRGLLAASHD